MIKPLLLIGISPNYGIVPSEIEKIQDGIKESLDNDYHVLIYTHVDIKDKKFDVICGQSEEDIENKSLEHFINKLMAKEYE